jgi:branched-chain amino acid aminotransferase
VNRIWFDGQLHEGALAISAHDRGLTLGDGLFETILVLNGVALWRNEHLQRMQAGASQLGIRFPAMEIDTAIDALVAETMTHHVLRMTLTRGDGGRALSIDTGRFTLIGTLADFDPALQFKPISLRTTSVERNLSSPSSTIKTTSYIDQILAVREVVQHGCDEALMFNSKGRVACCATGNIFMVTGDELVTPSLDEGILNGIMRSQVIHAAKSAGMKVAERLVYSADLAKADAMFVTNSLRFIRPVVLFDDRHMALPKLVLETITPYLMNRQSEQISRQRQE